MRGRLFEVDSSGITELESAGLRRRVSGVSYGSLGKRKGCEYKRSIEFQGPSSRVSDVILFNRAILNSVLAIKRGRNSLIAQNIELAFGFRAEISVQNGRWMKQLHRENESRPARRAGRCENTSSDSHVKRIVFMTPQEKLAGKEKVTRVSRQRLAGFGQVRHNHARFAPDRTSTSKFRFCR